MKTLRYICVTDIKANTNHLITRQHKYSLDSIVHFSEVYFLTVN